MNEQEYRAEPASTITVKYPDLDGQKKKALAKVFGVLALDGKRYSFNTGYIQVELKEL